MPGIAPSKIMPWASLPQRIFSTRVWPPMGLAEAKVEDLVGNTMGFIQTPVKVGRNARSLVATDAVAVRPFKGSVDKFEADQVLSRSEERRVGKECRSRWRHHKEKKQ